MGPKHSKKTHLCILLRTDKGICVCLYRSLFDCDSTEPANFFVSSEYLSLLRTLEASSSNTAPVCFLFPVWASAEAANFLAILDALLSARVFAACEAIFDEVCFLFWPYSFLEYDDQSKLDVGI